MLDKVIALKFTRDEFLGEFKRERYAKLKAEADFNNAILFRIKAGEVSLFKSCTQNYPYVITAKGKHVVNSIRGTEISDFDNPVIILILSLDHKYNTLDIPQGFRGSLIYKLEKLIIFDQEGWEENKENLLMNLESTNLGYISLEEFIINSYKENLWREKV